MNEGFIWGGAVAGLLAVGALGVYLARNAPALRRTLVPHIGEGPAQWAVFGVWFAYVVGALRALAQAIPLYQAYTDAPLPPPVAFGQGALVDIALPFLSFLLPVLHFAALLAAAGALYRYLKAEAP